MVSLKHIQVKGFKSIREMDLELRPLNVLIGANGAGKSNFLSVFELLGQTHRRNLSDYVERSGGADTFLRFGQKVTDTIEIRPDFGELYYLAHLKAAVGDNLDISVEIYQGFNEDGTPQLLWSYKEVKHLRSEGKSYHLGAADEILRLLSESRVYHFNDTTESAKIKKTALIDDNLYLRSDGANLASVLYLLRERYEFYYERIVDTIRRVAPFFDDFILEPRKLNPDTIQLDWRAKGSDLHMRAYMLSDGTLRFMCLATLLLQPQPPALILIDEPELGLHPHAIILLAAMLKSVAAKTQVIITAQSVSLVNQFLHDDLIVVEYEDKETKFKRWERSEIAHWTEEYAMGELWEKNIIGGTP